MFLPQSNIFEDFQSTPFPSCGRPSLTLVALCLLICMFLHSKLEEGRPWQAFADLNMP